jgi:crotonobetainyl-CoA:carnitine CoA-transferase CaiB-like acyl-CoA transferase
MRPLAGVRVVESANYISGPFAGLTLADLGAEVVKVEPPGGDPYRKFGPQDADGAVIFRAVNRNKRSVAIDLATKPGLGELFDLLDEADVLITNWRPGVAEAFGLTADVVRARWPRLVWARVSGYGQTGPMSRLPSFDSITQARVGLSAAIGDVPVLLPTYVADKVTATYVAQSVLAALVQRGNSGSGCVVDVAMIDALAYFDAPDLLAGHQSPDGYDDRVDRTLRAPRPLATSDGWIVIAPVSGKQIKRALAAAGLEHALDELRTQTDPFAATELFYRLFDGALRGRSTAEWEAIFAEADVPAGAVMTKAEHIVDEQVVHNATYRIVDDPYAGRVRRPRHPALFGATPVDTDDLPCPPRPTPTTPG